MKVRPERTDSAARGAIESGTARTRAVKTRAAKSRTGGRAHTDQPPSISIVTRSSAYMEPQVREAMIAESAYFRSAHRGFEPGHEVDDWLAAESEIDAALARGDLPRLCG